jgi:hypothetical protein
MLASLRDVPKMIAIGWLEAASQLGEIQPKKLFLLYFTLPYLTFFSCNRLYSKKRLSRFARTMARTTRFAVRKCLLGVALVGNYILGSKPQENPNFGTGMPNFQPNKYTRITFER